MKLPQLKRRLAQGAAWMVMGSLAGAVGVDLLTGARIERLMLQLAAQTERADRLQTEVEGLERSLKTHLARPIKRVEVRVLDVDDERARLAIERDIYDLFEHFVGDDMNRLDAVTVRRLTERTLLVDKRQFHVRAWGVFAAQDVLQLYVTAERVG
ncbi:MAG TPA: hypothetical protein VFK80_02020 [Limnochordia bacterium]|nr:hypothetical protein [Limnochordia bacterium]